MNNCAKIFILLSAYFLQGNALECYQCDSEIDPDCVKWNNQIKTEQCHEQDEACVSVYIKDEKETVRGCKSRIPNLKECKTPHCLSCTEDKCNNKIIPEDRPFCHQCDSNTDPKCKSEISEDAEASICEKYTFRGKCFVAVSDDLKQVQRGCHSDDNELCNKGHKYPCYTCKDSDKACNTIEAIREASCYSCNSQDENCAWYMKGSKVNPKQCSVLLGDKKVCYTHEIEGGIVNRGCFLDLAEDDPIRKSCASEESPTCKTCSENDCNFEKSKTKFHSCYKCRSSKDDQKSCASDVKKITPENCYSPSQLKSDIGCYILQLVGDTIRGCSSDMTPELAEQCKRESKFCKKCNEDFCNNDQLIPRNGANTNSGLFPLLLIMSALCIENYF